MIITATAYLSSGREYGTGMSHSLISSDMREALAFAISHTTLTVIDNMRRYGHDAREYRIELKFE